MTFFYRVEKKQKKTITITILDQLERMADGAEV